MAEVKKYFWLKLKEGFFGEKEIKKLRNIAGGDTYTIIYLKLLLLSLRENGRLYHDGIEEHFYEELALEIDEEPDNVRVTLMYLCKMGLMEEISPTEAFLTRIPESVGSETAKAELMRKSRARKKALDGGGGNIVTDVLPPVTERYPEIDKREKIKDLDIEGERKEKGAAPQTHAPSPDESTSEQPVKNVRGEYKHVLLTDKEESQLMEEYGEILTLKAIDHLDQYIERKGCNDKNHYLTIRAWVIDAVQERMQKNGESANSSFNTDEFFQAALARSYGDLAPGATRQAPQATGTNEALQERVEALKRRIQ